MAKAEAAGPPSDGHVDLVCAVVSKQINSVVCKLETESACLRALDVGS